MNDRILIDINELSRPIGIPKGTLCQWVYLRRIPFTKGGRSLRFSGKVGGPPPLPMVRLGRRVLVRRKAPQQWLLLLERQEREVAYASGLSTNHLDKDWEKIAD